MGRVLLRGGLSNQPEKSLASGRGFMPCSPQLGFMEFLQSERTFHQQWCFSWITRVPAQPAAAPHTVCHPLRSCCTHGCKALCLSQA